MNQKGQKKLKLYWSKGYGGEKKYLKGKWPKTRLHQQNLLQLGQGSLDLSSYMAQETKVTCSE